MKLFNIISSLILLTLFSSLSGFPQSPLSLSDAIKKGLENNFDIRISKQDLEIAKLNNNWGTAGRYPTISLNVSNMNTRNIGDAPAQPGTEAKYNANVISPGVSMRWTLFNGFAVNITKQKLAKLEQLSEGLVTIMVENGLQGVILAYYTSLLEQEKLSIVSNVMKLSRDRYNYMMTKKELGAAVTYEVLQAKNSYLNDSTTFLLQKLTFENSLRSLNLLLGEPASNVYDLTEKFEAPVQVYQFASLQTKMLANNRNLLNQYTNLSMLEQDIRLKKSSLYPSLSMTAGTDFTKTRNKPDDLDPINFETTRYYANFTLSWTLFNGGRIKRSIKAAKIERETGEIEIQQIKFELNNALFNALEFYKIRKQIYDVAIETIESAQLNLDISNDKYKAGTINSFNYRDVQLIYLNAAFGKLQAIYNIIDTHTSLLRLTGGIVSEY